MDSRRATLMGCPDPDDDKVLETAVRAFVDELNGAPRFSPLVVATLAA